MCYKSEILNFKPIYESILPILGHRPRFYQPLNVQEQDVAIGFAGIFYDGRGLTQQEKDKIVRARILFDAMKERCHEIIGCDMHDFEYPFKVQLPLKTFRVIDNPSCDCP